MDKITIRRPDDFHVHFRRGQMLETVAPFTMRHFGRAMVMPNTFPKPILTAGDAADYRLEILKCAESMGADGIGMEWRIYDDFVPLMTIQITDDTTPEIVREAKKHGFIIAGKVYPKGVTTNSHNGVSDFGKLYPVFAEMEKIGMVLSLHGQVPSSFCLDREKDFLRTLLQIAASFPKLKIVMEHISTEESISVVEAIPNIFATITAHHLVLNLHDVLSWVGENGNEGLNPHHYCQPIPQHPNDMLALQEAVLSGSPKFFFGSDTAPHRREQKESSCGCAGVFSAPVILPVLTDFFTSQLDLNTEEARSLLQKFTSESGANFYGLPLNDGEITIAKEPWTVPNEYDGVVPLYAGKTLDWQVDGLL